MVSQKKLKSITDMIFTDRSLGSVKQLISAAVSLSEKVPPFGVHLTCIVIPRLATVCLPYLLPLVMLSFFFILLINLRF